MTNGGSDLLVGPPGTSPTSTRKTSVGDRPSNQPQQHLSAAALARHLPKEEDIFPGTAGKGLPKVVSNEEMVVLDEDDQPMSEERKAQLNAIMARLYPEESENYQPSSRECATPKIVNCQWSIDL